VALPPFQTLLDSYGRDVQRFLIANIGPVDADDCWQETWLSALHLRAWVFTIAHRKLIDHARARGRRAIPVAEAVELASAEPATATALPDAQLWSSVAGLPDKQRTAVTLRFLIDSSYREIAVVMETSEEAARRNVHEALKRLRKELNR